MVLLALLVGLPVAVLAAALVYADASRRGLPRAMRTRWAGGVGLTTIAGFVVAFASEGYLFALYVALRGDATVVHTPFEVLAGLAVVGLAVGASAVLAYVVRTRGGVSHDDIDG